MTTNYGGTYMPENQQPESDAVKIAHDKEKTKRYTIYIGAFVLIALVGIILVFNATGDGNRKFDLNMKEMKLSVSVDRPIVQQVNQPTSSYSTPKGDVKFTTGTVSPEIISQLEANNVSIAETSFTGKNYINKSFQFLFSFQYHEIWQVQYTPNDVQGTVTTVNKFLDNSGNFMSIGVEQIPAGTNFQAYVNENIRQLMATGQVAMEPDVDLEVSSGTAFFSYFISSTGGMMVQKLIVRGTNAYVASAYFSPTVNNVSAADMLLMISTFTLLG